MGSVRVCEEEEEGLYEYLLRQGEREEESTVTVRVWCRRKRGDISQNHHTNASMESKHTEIPVL